MTADEFAAMIVAGLAPSQINRLALMRYLLRRDGHGHALATPDVLRQRRER